MNYTINCDKLELLKIQELKQLIRLHNKNIIDTNKDKNYLIKYYNDGPKINILDKIINNFDFIIHNNENDEQIIFLFINYELPENLYNKLIL
jgi:hypothetical protein